MLTANKASQVWGFQARGGLLVSAAKGPRGVEVVTIQARRDIPCRLKNPWPGSAPSVRRASDNSPVAVKPDPAYADGILFQAQQGETYVIRSTDR